MISNKLLEIIVFNSGMGNIRNVTFTPTREERKMKDSRLLYQIFEFPEPLHIGDESKEIVLFHDASEKRWGLSTRSLAWQVADVLENTAKTCFTLEELNKKLGNTPKHASVGPDGPIRGEKSDAEAGGGSE